MVPQPEKNMVNKNIVIGIKYLFIFKSNNLLYGTEIGSEMDKILVYPLTLTRIFHVAGAPYLFTLQRHAVVTTELCLVKQIAKARQLREIVRRQLLLPTDDNYRKS